MHCTHRPSKLLLRHGDWALSVSTTLMMLLHLPGCLLISLCMLKADAISYAPWKYLRAGYTFLPLAAISLNALCVPLIL